MRVRVRTASGGKYLGISLASSALDAGATSDGLITQQLPAARFPKVEMGVRVCEGVVRV